MAKVKEKGVGILWKHTKRIKNAVCGTLLFNKSVKIMKNELRNYLDYTANTFKKTSEIHNSLEENIHFFFTV